MFEIYLQKALSNNCLPQALLFIGPKGESHAKTLAAQLLKTNPQRIEAGNHPDYHTFHPEGKSGLHPIESIRHLIDVVYQAPFEAERKVLLIHSSERMQPAAANALLKTLEEPLLDTQFILLTEDARQILPTILSRCTQLSLPGNLSIPSIDFSKLPAEIHRMEKELEEIEDPLQRSRRFDQILEMLLMWMRDAHARKEGLPKERLFFPDAPSPCTLFSLEKVEQALQKVRFAYQRNIKLSACLDQVLSYFGKK